MLSRLFPRPPLPRDWNILLEKSATKVSFPTDVDPRLPPTNPDTNGIVLLTTLLRALGYFLAGACAGIASRTATAPLDRLKVYLIAQTSTKKAAVEAVKDGSPVKAVRRFGRPLVDAMKDLWAAGGIRSLFAGKFTCHVCRRIIEAVDSC
jgi:Mitochondrial carrier protein